MRDLSRPHPATEDKVSRWKSLLFSFLFLVSCSDIEEEKEVECFELEVQQCEGNNKGTCFSGERYCYLGIYSECFGIVPPEEEICDNLDNDCDGDVDEGVKNRCGTCAQIPNEICDGIDNDCDEQIDEGFSDVAELCDGRDNDCDGRIDEGWSKRVPCLYEETNPWIIYSDEFENSSCVRGWRLCVDGEFTECQGFEGPQEEACDSIDNDCDGDVDEGIILEGRCGVTDMGICTLGEQICYDSELICYGATNPQNESCNGLDDDCDGYTDEDLERECETECGAGIERCFRGEWIGCNAPQPQEETCDGIDNNCNGFIDEDLICQCQEGSVQICPYYPDGCGYGAQTCISGEWSECTGSLLQPEICNNYDDNCDGNIDENIYRNCYSGPPETIGVGICGTGVQQCIAGNWTLCDGETIPEEEICDGIDNDCNGEADDLERIFEKADIVFAIDVSGSMDERIEALIAGISNLATSLVGEHKFSIVTFGQAEEEGEPFLYLSLQDIDIFLITLQNMITGGGTEPSLDALNSLASPDNPLSMNWRSDATPIIILMTDEQAQTTTNVTWHVVRPNVELCVLPGCNSSTNSSWRDGDPLELFVITQRDFFSPWDQLVSAQNHLIEINRTSNETLLQEDLSFIFSEICIENP